MAESKTEDLHLGASHVDKIGKIVVVDIEGTGRVASVGIRGGLIGERKNRVILTGVLHGTEDIYNEGGDPKSTHLTVGEVTVFIDWNDEPSILISTVASKGSK